MIFTGETVLTWAELVASGVAFNLTDGRAGHTTIGYRVTVHVLPAFSVCNASLVGHVRTERCRFGWIHR